MRIGSGLYFISLLRLEILGCYGCYQIFQTDVYLIVLDLGDGDLPDSATIDGADGCHDSLGLEEGSGPRL